MLIKLLLLAFFIDSCLSDVEVETNAFRVYRQAQKTTQKNHIKLSFKTTHSTGLIMFAQGANKKDFLSIELYRGKIRVAANYGRGTDNKLRPIAGFYDMYLGKDLADNEWHTVEFIRNVRESTIFIDRGRGKMEKSSFMKSPPTYNELSVSMITFGGYYSFQTSELSTNKALSRKGLKACFSEASFSQYWPEYDSKEIDFVNPSRNGNGPRITNIGDIANSCANPPYKPMFFPSSAVHISLIENYTIDAMKVSLMFRTVVNNQILVNYTTIGTADKIQLKIDRKGRVALGVEFNDNMQIIETAKEDYHDSQWHSAAFEVDNKPASDNTYIARFTVDGKTRLATVNGKFHFDGYVNVGFGFTGCLRDVKINDDEIDKVRRNGKDAEQYFTYEDVGVVYNQCSLKDYCNPNPCLNGGKCNQTEDNIVCDCRHTLYEGSTCNKARFNYTCAGVRKSGERRSDVYFIDFDGMGPMEPVRALCDLGRTIENTVTQINNTDYGDFSVKTPTGKNDVDIIYGASITQMRELIMNSAYCEQYIKYTCSGTPIFRSPEGPPAVRWMGGDDVLHYYWGGARNNRGYCQCGLTQECLNRGKYCNCDDLEAYEDVFDEGNFTIKGHLPVRQVKFDNVLDDNSIKAILRVGHLRCAGFGSRDVAATFRKPYSFLSVDHPDQPFDNIFAGGLSFDFKTSVAYNYMTMIHAHGPFSGDYVKIMVWSRTMVRVHLNFGFGDIKQDVDISRIGRTLDDNQWHEFDLMFNLKELNVTLDGVQMIQGLPLQEDPVQFNVDDKSVYIGGSYHDRNGFIGCIRSLYVNGRIHDIRGIAEGQEDYGVYPGCGSACVLLNKPCNYGACVDEYDAFKCNCSISPYDGKYCQNETLAKAFTNGQYVTYDLEKANLTEPVSTAVFVIGFKTTEENVALAQLKGKNDRHVSLFLAGGYPTLLFSFKEKKRNRKGTLTDSETEILQITKRKLNNDKHNIIRVHISYEEIYLTVPNLDLVVGTNMTDRFINENNKNEGRKMDEFAIPTVFTIGRIQNTIGINPGANQLGTSFIGCMSGAKLVLHHQATIMKPYRESVEIDMFKLIENKQTGSTDDVNPSGSFPSATARCGPILGTPGKLPTVGPPRQFATLSPGLDNSVTLKKIDMLNIIILAIVVVVSSLILLGFFFAIYSYINRSHVQYKALRRDTKKKRAPASREMANAPPTHVQQPSRSYTEQPTSRDDDMFL